MKNAAEEKQWIEQMNELRARNFEASWYDLTLMVDVISRSPWNWISEAMLMVNGGFLPKEKYERTVSALMADGTLRVKELRKFHIDRRKVPQVEVKSVLQIPLLTEWRVAAGPSR